MPLEELAHEVRIDPLDGHDKIRRQQFHRVDKEERPAFVMLVLDPECGYFVETMQNAVDAHASVGYLESRERRRRVGEKSERNRGNKNEDAEENVVEKHAEHRAAHGNNAKRPKPIGSALDKFMLVRAPAQNLPRRHIISLYHRQALRRRQKLLHWGGGKSLLPYLERFRRVAVIGVRRLDRSGRRGSGRAEIRVLRRVERCLDAVRIAGDEV